MTALRAVRRLLRRAVAAGDHGGAMVEFVVLAVVLVVPLAYLVLTVFEVQRATFATSAAAREAGRVFVVSPTTADGEQRARAAVALALRDQGLSTSATDVAIECAADPCLTPGARVTVRVVTVVRLPFVPWQATAASIPVRAAHTQTVDVYAAAGP